MGGGQYAAAMELLSLAFTSGWTSGINAYATVLVLGLLGRFAGIEEVPGGLERTDVLIAAGVLTIATMGRVRHGWRVFRRWMQPT